MIGGSPSTGSSVLVNILNRHPELLAGPETFLFIHPKLYQVWREYRKYLVQRSKLGGLKSEGWFRINGADLLDPFYGWKAPGIAEIIETAVDFPAFADAFFSPSLRQKGASRWVEKSPSNAICLDIFPGHFPGGKVVHTTRNPYDTIASLVSRGHSPFYATAAYLVNTAFALKAAGSDRHHLLKYEKWVLEPEAELSSLFGFLGLAWDPEVLEPASGEKDVRMEGWLHNERGKLESGSVGRFGRLEEKDQEAILYLVNRLRIRKDYQERHGLQVSQIADLCGHLGYETQMPGRSAYAASVVSCLKDRLTRLVRLYGTGWLYPVQL